MDSVDLARFQFALKKVVTVPHTRRSSVQLSMSGNRHEKINNCLIESNGAETAAMTLAGYGIYIFRWKSNILNGLAGSLR
jgi:hypothetical protein